MSHTLSLYCSADFIPDEITIDVAGMKIGQSIHMSDIKLPEGVTAVSRDDVTLCTIAAQAKEEVVEEVAAPVDVPATAQKAPAEGAAAAAPAAGAKGAAPAAGAKGAAPAAAAAAPAKGAAPAPAAPAPKKK